jgi:hypothetical protein
LKIEFVTVKGEAVELTNEYIEGLSDLCAEFDFRNLSQHVQRSRRSRTVLPREQFRRHMQAGFGWTVIEGKRVAVAP